MKSKIGLIIVLILIIGGVTISIFTKNDNNLLNDVQESKTEQKDNEDINQDSNLNNSNELKKVEQKDYTTLTYGKDSYDKTETPIGSKIKAYPLDIAEVLSEESVAIKYGDLYKGEWIVVTGYVHYQKRGFFVISPSNNQNIEKYIGTVVAEDENIRTDYNWNIKDGDYITIAGFCQGTYRPGIQEYYMVMNDVFIVE